MLESQSGRGVWLNTVCTVQHGRDVLDNNHAICTNAQPCDEPADNAGPCWALFIVRPCGGSCVLSASVLATASPNPR